MIDVTTLMATRLMEDTQSSSGDAFLKEEMRDEASFLTDVALYSQPDTAGCLGLRPDKNNLIRLREGWKFSTEDRKVSGFCLEGLVQTNYNIHGLLRIFLSYSSW